MNDWTLNLGENLSIRPEPKNEINKYLRLLLKTHGGLAIQWKERLVDMLKLFFTSYKLIQWTLLVLLSQGERVNFWDGQSLKIPRTILFRGEEKYIEVLKKQLN